MGHLGWLFLLITPLIWLHIQGAASHSLPACSQQLEFRCSDGSCLSKLKLCDGRTDCADGSDEHRCGHSRCGKDEFPCRNRHCIPVKLLCNGIDDCGDGSDEDSCHNCPAGSFSCGPTEVCLLRNKLCDGWSDCKDGRDEAHVLCGSVQASPQRSSACAASEFRCGDGACIRHAWRCDHSPDCSDGSDEENCDISEQDECRDNNGGCSHYCLDQPIGFFCHCPDNMKLVEDSRCEEVDVCLERDVCDQLCVHRNGSLTCECQEGYHMDPLTGECKAKGSGAQLVFSSSKGIQVKNLINKEYKLLVPHLPRPGPLAVLASNHTVYWAQQGHGSIYRMSVAENPKEAVLVLKVQGSVSGLAVDWIHQLLYWTSVEAGSVNVALLDGLLQRQLITKLNKPSAVVVDPLQGFLFWAQCGNTPVIQRANQDGRDRITLVTSLIRQPVALSLDLPRRLLYWFDQGMRSISRINLEGRHRKTVVESNGYLDRMFGFAVFEGLLYWGDEATHSICRANKHNGQNLQVMMSNITLSGGVVIVHSALQPNGAAACGRPGTVCQQGCVVDLMSERQQFSCDSQRTKPNKPQLPSISRSVPASTLSDPTYPGILSLIMLLSILLVGMAVWWWREEFRPSRSFTLQSFSLKESRDLLIAQEPLVSPNTTLLKETRLRLDLDSE